MTTGPFLMVVNPEFTDDLDGWVPTGTWAYDPLVGSPGLGSARITNNGELVSAEPMDVAPGMRLHLSCRVRWAQATSDTSDALQIGMEFFDDEHAEIGYLAADGCPGTDDSDTFYTLTGDITVPQGAVTGRIRLSTQGFIGLGWFDHIRCRDADLLLDCIDPSHLRRVAGGAITPQPWMQWRRVASDFAPSVMGSYAVTGGGNKSDLLQTVVCGWRNESPLIQHVYGLVTRGGSRVSLQAKSRGYLEMRHAWSGFTAVPNQWVEVLSDILATWSTGQPGPKPDWQVTLQEMLASWAITVPEKPHSWVETLLDMLHTWTGGGHGSPGTWEATLDDILHTFLAQPLITSPRVAVSRTGVGADAGLGGMLALGTGFCVAEWRENSSTIPLMPQMTGWQTVQPGKWFYGGAEVWFVSEHWEGNVIDGGAQGSESSFETGDLRIDLFAVPVIVV